MPRLLLERYFLFRLDALLLPNYVAHLLIDPFGLNPGAHGGIRPDRVCPYPVCRVPPVPCLLQHLDDGLAGLILGTAFTKLDGHLSVPFALEKADASNGVRGDAKGIDYPLPLS